MSRYFATVAKGIEPITAKELAVLGAKNIETTFGGVHFDGDLDLLYRANLELRTATRILMPLREFAAKTPEMLYDQVRRIKWDEILDPEKTFAVDCTIAGAKSLGRGREIGDVRAPVRPLGRPAVAPRERSADPVVDRAQGINHSKYASLKIKDAIVDELRQRQGARPNVDRERPDVQVHAYLREGRCILSLDSSGPSLHERAYRLDGMRAPLKETLAAAIVELTEWDMKSPFVDPMCGSGTIALEAALKGMNIAPGLYREHFGFMGWKDFDEKLYSGIVDAARSRVKTRLENPIVGFDRDRDAVAAAIENSGRAGLTKAVHFERREFDSLAPVGKGPGVVVVNPPYGERLGELEELRVLYKTIGDLFKQRMKGWTGYIFTGNLELAKSVGLKASRRMELYNGAIECRLLKYELYDGSKNAHTKNTTNDV